MRFVSVVPIGVSIVMGVCLVQERAQRGVIEVETIRVVKDGKVVWEVSGSPGGGARMRFCDGERDAYTIVAEKNVVAIEAAADDSRLDVVVGHSLFSESITMKDTMKGKSVGLQRSVSEKGGVWQLLRKSVLDGGAIIEEMNANGVEISVTSGNNHCNLESRAGGLARIAFQAQDVDLDAKIGVAQHSLRLVGRLVEGLELTLRNAAGLWTWSSK